jgi:hypothetical protein
MAPIRCVPWPMTWRVPLHPLPGRTGKLNPIHFKGRLLGAFFAWCSWTPPSGEDAAAALRRTKKRAQFL